MNLSPDRLAQRLETELGAGVVSAAATKTTAHAIDGRTPLLICQPNDALQIGALLRLCAEAQAAVAPWGGGTAIALGNPPRALDVVVATGKLDKVIEHDDANLTATVQSGIALNDLQNALAQRNQRAPFDPPFPERATIGGVVAANLNGPRRSFYGNVRDLVIGMKVALASGEVIKAGGKVVKNVAGYDMCKLFVGSLGTLGVVTEVTIRMAALPERSAIVSAGAALSQVLPLAEAIASSPLLPAAVLVSSRAVLDDAPTEWQLTVRCEGLAETIVRQLNDIETMANRSGMQTMVAENPLGDRRWQQLCDFPARRDAILYRVTVPRAALRSVLETIASWGFATAFLADLAAAVLWIACPANDASAKLLTKLSALAMAQRGHAVMFAARANLKAGLDVWGPPPPSLALMRKIKQQFDPQEILNPGRFLGGL